MPMQPWFREAKLGVFLHYGVYAVDGVPESWAFYRGDVPHERYMSQLGRFTASAYDPGEWAALFARAGARYAVLTARHHDGVALWDTGQGDLSVVARSPAGRDLVAPYAEAMRERGLKVGLYCPRRALRRRAASGVRRRAPEVRSAEPEVGRGKWEGVESAVPSVRGAQWLSAVPGRRRAPHAERRPVRVGTPC